MNMPTKAILGAALAACFSASVLAQMPADRRIDNQNRRIESGVQSGQLTDREAHRLDARENHIERMSDRMHADGKMTGRETARLDAAQDRTSRGIARQKHDGQHDFNHDGRMDRPHARR